jgi:hypothetical protein
MLQLATPPANTYELIARAISQLSTAGGSADRVTNVNDPSKLSAALQHKVYTLGRSDIVQGRNLDKARVLAWRFLIQYGTKILAATEFSCDAQGQNLRFASLDTGPFAQGTREAVRLAEGLASVKAGSYELRALRAPSVYAMALWLMNLQRGDDIIIPILPAGPGPQPASEGGGPLPQSPRDFLDRLRSTASTLGSGGAPPPSPGG